MKRKRKWKMDVEKLKEAGIVSIRDELLRQQAEGRTIARTESGDPSFDPPLAVSAAIAKALFTGKTHYTAGAGIPELRRAAAMKVVNENFIHGINMDNVLVTNGAMHGLYIAFQAMFISPNKGAVAVPTPTWTETEDNIRLAGGQIAHFDFPIDDMEKFESDVRRWRGVSNLKAVVLNTPHNPTGHVMSTEQLMLVARLCDELDLWLVSDEAYEHLTYNREHVSPARFMQSDNHVTLFSCSKSYAMSGLRVGYLVTPHKPLMRRLRYLTRCTINGVNSIAQYGAAEALLRTDQQYRTKMVLEYKKRRNILYSALQKCSFLEPAVEPEGAFYIWARIKDFDPDKDSGWDTTVRLLESGVGSAPGEVFGPGGKGFVRFAFSCATDHVERAAEKLAVM